MSNMEYSISRRTYGFTVVELLIVIIVIGILSSILLVSYNGAQDGARTQGAQASAATLARKIESYGALKNSFPIALTATEYVAALNSTTDSSLTSSGLIIGDPTNTNGTTTLQVSQCQSSPGQAYRIRYWDFSKKQISSTDSSGTLGISGCATWKILE